MNLTCGADCAARAAITLEQAWAGNMHPKCGSAVQNGRGGVPGNSLWTASLRKHACTGYTLMEWNRLEL